MYQGSCLCGSVHYEIESDLKAMVNCHCQFCRKAHGAAFVTLLFVPHSNIKFTKGDDLVSRYHVDALNADRCFCNQCGTRLYNHLPVMNMASVVVATLDTDKEIKPVAHVNIESKCAWYSINDELPQYQTAPGSEEFRRLLSNVG